MSNYERGVALPSPHNLPIIAEVYRIPFPDIQKAYKQSKVGPDDAPLSQKPFVELLFDMKRDDHLVVVCQRSTIPHNLDHEAAVLGLLKNGVKLTYVSYIPSTHNYQDLAWEHNHTQAARKIRVGILNDKDIPGTTKDNVCYLLIRNPTSTDYRFLRDDEAIVYLCENSDDLPNDSTAFTELETPQGESWWHPRHSRFRSELYNWLVHQCGLRLPSNQFDLDRVAISKFRQVEIKSLEQFLHGYSSAMPAAPSDLEAESMH